MCPPQSHLNQLRSYRLTTQRWRRTHLEERARGVMWGIYKTRRKNKDTHTHTIKRDASWKESLHSWPLFARPQTPPNPPPKPGPSRVLRQIQQARHQRRRRLRAGHPGHLVAVLRRLPDLLLAPSIERSEGFGCERGEAFRCPFWWNVD